MESPVPYDEGVWFYIWCLHGSPFLRPSFVALYTGSQDTAPMYWQQSAVSLPLLSWHLGDGDESTRNWGMNFLAQEFHDLSIKFWIPWTDTPTKAKELSWVLGGLCHINPLLASCNFYLDSQLNSYTPINPLHQFGISAIYPAGLPTIPGPLKCSHVYSYMGHDTFCFFMYILPPLTQ